MSPRTYDMTRRRAAVEETRRRIVEATMELHAEHGILATSWEQIAERAGVAPGTVYRHFPSLDELVPACGELSFTILDLPGEERRRELFAGARSRAERLRRLVGECYGIYERGAGVIVAVRRRREQETLPAVAEAHASVEAALDGLVAAALEPDGAGDAERRVVRAICDLDAWQALRRQGLEGAAAVDAAAALLAGMRRPGGS